MEIDNQIGKDLQLSESPNVKQLRTSSLRNSHLKSVLLPALVKEVDFVADRTNGNMLLESIYYRILGPKIFNHKTIAAFLSPSC